MRMKAGWAGMLLVCVLVTSMPTLSADGLYTGAQLEARVRNQLVHLRIADLRVEVRGWEVTLAGTAESLAQTQQAVNIAMQEPGIEEVFNELQVVHVADDLLRSAIMATLEKDRRHYTVYDVVNVLADDGQVFLSGHAIDARAAEAIVESVAKVRGVSAIDNEIDSSPMSRADEELQTALVFTINNALTPYIEANPSVHVMVKDGHVSLSGFVDGAEARKAVEKAVMKAKGVLSVENALQARTHA